jgi:phosphoglycerate dehydrogenase-like enzyme
MDKQKILVTPRSLSRGGHPSFELLAEAGYEVVFATPGQQPTEEELLAILPECVGMLAGVEPITRAVLEAAAGSLKVISRNGTGVSSIDLDAAAEFGIRICRAEGANARGVAELAFGLILSLVRSVPLSDASLKGRNWQRRKGVELEGRTLGLVGCGRIGKLVAAFALAFGMDILAHDPYPDASFSPGEGFSWAGLSEVLARADVVSLHCPPADNGRPLIDADRIAAMKDGAYLINTARGALLDDVAVLAALDSGKIAGLAVDAFEPEPPTDWRLAQHPNVIATPHVGGFTAESVDRAAAAAVANMLAALKGG